MNFSLVLQSTGDRFKRAMPKNLNYTLMFHTFLQILSAKTLYGSLMIALLSVVLYESIIDPNTLFYQLIPLAYTVHIHVFPLHLLKRRSTCMQRNRHLTLVLLKKTFLFNCDGYYFDCSFVVTVNHTVIWGFVLSILLSLNIISIIVCCMFDV